MGGVSSAPAEEVTAGADSRFEKRNTKAVPDFQKHDGNPSENGRRNA